MDSVLEVVLSVVLSVIASSGFWAWLTSRLNKKDAKSELLMGLAHDRIVTLGMTYIERGWITKDEYENLHNYLYAPYLKNGGQEDGSAKRIMDSVCLLPIHGVACSVVDFKAT